MLVFMTDYSEWDSIYRQVPVNELGWELRKPRPILVEQLKKGLIHRGSALDLCCGLATNTIYLAQSGFATTGLDISKTALKAANNRTRKAGMQVGLLNGSFVDLPFAAGVFSFVFDMGCFHHVAVEDRSSFITGVHRVLKDGGNYLLTCFSYRNGVGWNHFTKGQIINLFQGHFRLENMEHYASLEGDDVTRFFYTVLMTKKSLVKGEG